MTQEIFRFCIMNLYGLISSVFAGFFIDKPLSPNKLLTGQIDTKMQLCKFCLQTENQRLVVVLPRL